jgi:hypothetical protein
MIFVFFSEYISIQKKGGVEYSYIIVFSLWQDMESCCFSSSIGEVSNGSLCLLEEYIWVVLEEKIKGIFELSEVEHI